MAKRMCLLTGNETNCTDSCYLCGCGGETALNDYYVPIYNIQRVCDIVKGFTCTSTEGEEIAEYIRNELERMAVEKSDVQPVKHGEWQINPNISHEPFCSECKETPCYRSSLPKFCPNCGARMDGGVDND